MPVIRRDDLEKNPGDTVRVDIVLALTGAAVTIPAASGQAAPASPATCAQKG